MKKLPDDSQETEAADLDERAAEDVAELFRGLEAIAQDCFPRTCPNCNKVYHSAEDFLIKETRSLHHSTGLRAGQDDEDKTVIEVYRNCTCGSTLVEFFQERRDMSPLGVRRRQRFGRLLDLLIRRGVPGQEARRALIRALRGQSSKVLDDLGITFAEL